MEERIAQSGAARGPLVSCFAFGASFASAIATLQHETLASLMYPSATSASSLSPPTRPFGSKWIPNQDFATRLPKHRTAVCVRTMGSLPDGTLCGYCFEPHATYTPDGMSPICPTCMDLPPDKVNIFSRRYTKLWRAYYSFCKTHPVFQSPEISIVIASYLFSP